MSIHFSKAVLCEDCQRITESRTGVCSDCGSRAISSVQRLIEKSMPAQIESVSELEKLYAKKG